jgi:uncharacterized protein YegJ (DUF2314 family)
MSERVFMFDGQDPQMLQAYAAAQQSFKYFWRELSWERRRIVPGLDMAMVKLPFSDGPRTDGQGEYEHMWVGDVDFDGETLTGELLNSPNWLASVKEGDAIRVPFAHLTDWMMTVDKRAYGGFTVNNMRAQMSSSERKQHDSAWGLDFGDPADVRVEIERGSKPKGGFLAGLFGGRAKSPAPPESFRDHPMCVNMLPKIEEQLKADPSIAQSVDDDGWTLLQCEALAGNWGVVKLLVAYGADVAAQTPTGRTAAELARAIGWEEIASCLDGQPNSTSA